MVSTVEVDAAAKSMTSTEHGSVREHHLEVLDRSFAEREVLDIGLLVFGRAGAKLIPSGTDASSKVRDHRASMVDQKL